MSRIILANQSSTPDDAGSGNGQLFVEGNKLFQQIGTDNAQELKTSTPKMSGFTSSGDFIAPADCTSVKIQLWGGGGAGQYDGDDNPGAFCGGGGAHIVSIVTVTPGTSYTVTVGAGATSNPSDGGDTSVTINSVTYTAGGGGGDATWGSSSYNFGGTATNGNVLNLNGSGGTRLNNAGYGAGGNCPLGGAGMSTQYAYEGGDQSTRLRGGFPGGGGGGYAFGADGLALFSW